MLLSPDAMNASRDPLASSDKPGDGPGLLEEVCLLGRELRATAHSRVRLAALETRQAGESLVSIIATGLIAAGLVFSAWLALVGVVMMALVERGQITIPAALLLAMSVNVLIAVILIAVIRRKSRRLLYSATVNSLAPPPRDASKPGASA